MVRGVLSGERVEKIGIVRAGRLSEFFLSLPAITAVRERYPKAELVLFGDEWQKSFMRHYPMLVDRVEVLPYFAPFEVAQREPAFRRFITRIAKEKYDLILQIQDDGIDSNQLVRSFAPRISAGFASIEAEPLDISLPYIIHQHETMRAVELLEALDIHNYTLTSRLQIKRSDHEEYADYYRPDGRELIVLHPGGQDPRRHWPPEFYGEVGDYFAEQGYRVLITANILEYSMAESVLYVMQQPAEALVGVLSLPALMALLSRARMVISNDTGPLYVARTVNTPSVGLYWGLNYIHGGPLFTQHDRALVDWQLSCPRCGDDTLFDVWPPKLPSPGGCKHDQSMVEGIKPDQVIETAENLLLDTVTGLSL